MRTKKRRDNIKETPTGAPSEGPLSVLIVGGKEALEGTREILDSLAIMGFTPNLIGVVHWGRKHVLRQVAPDSGIRVFDDYIKPISEETPDLLVITCDDHRLRKHLTQIIPPRTRILDSFALNAFQALKQCTGQLGKTQDKLQSVELIKEVLMAGSEISMKVIDEDFNVLEINNDILARSKMSREECIGKPCHWVINRYLEPCHQKGSKCPVVEVLRTGHSSHHVREEIREDGTVGYFTVSAYPLTEDERGKKCVLVIWKDVTRAMTPLLDRQAESIRKNFLHFLHQDKMVALGKLAAAAVHEINNPIQGILTFSKLMISSLNRENIAPEDVVKFRRYLGLIASESSRCGQILRNLLSFAREGELEKDFFDVCTLLEEILLLTGNRMELQGITLKQEIAANLPPMYGDRDHIKQAVLNLILNAVEAMPNGGIISLSVKLSPDKKHISMSVSDTGGGVPKKVQSSIFEPFITTKEDGKGVGLGLSVVYGIVAQHEGSIEVESEEGKGANFVLTFPVVRKSRKPDVS
jgi:two-component system, NtrC family, sensor kinase